MSSDVCVGFGQLIRLQLLVQVESKVSFGVGGSMLMVAMMIAMGPQ